MMMRRAVIGLLALGMVWMVAPGAPKADLGGGGQAFVNELATTAISRLADTGIDGTERRQRFRVIMHEYFAVKSIAKWVLGRHWRRATTEQKTTYIELFENMLVERYADQFANYSGERLKVVSADVRSERDVIVNSELVRPGSNKPVDVSWRLGVVGPEKYKVVDVIVAGLSLSLAQKKEFASVIRQNDNSIDALLEKMRETSESLKSKQQSEVSEQK